MVLAVHDFAAEALVCLARAERLDRENARWPYYQAITLLEGNPEAAIGKLQRAIELCGDKPDAPRLRLADLLLTQGRVDEAEQQYLHLLRHNPDHPRAHLGLARVAYERDNLLDSQTHLRWSSFSSFTRKASHALLAEIHHRLADKKAAADDLRQIARTPNDSLWPDPYYQEVEELKTGSQALIDRAEALLGQKRVREAIALLEQRVQEYPDSEWATWLWLGKAYIQEKNFRAAERPLREAARLAPQAVEAQYYLGGALLSQGKLRDAASCFRRATELKPDHVAAHCYLGQCLKQQGDRAGAIKAFRTALGCQPDVADAHVDLGELLLQDGHYGEAFAHLRLALEMNPEDAKAKRLLQRVLRQLVIPAP